MFVIRIINNIEKDDTGYGEIISKEDFKKKIHFKPSHSNLKVLPDQIVCINFVEEFIVFSHFEPEKHTSFLDFDEIRTKTIGLSLIKNSALVDFILDNDLQNNQNPKACELKRIKQMIGFRLGYPSTKIFQHDLELAKNEIENYTINYTEGGYNKPGDWSKGFVRIDCSSSHRKLDVYMKKLLPDLSFNLGESDDCEVYKFKNEIVGKLRKEIGIEKIAEIKRLCTELSLNIKTFAKLMYNESEHADMLWHYCHKLRKEIVNDYKLIEKS